MKKYLEYNDKKSSKFWQLELKGTKFVVTYGKIGNKGNSSEKEFDSEEKALKEASRLITSKTKKGYVEVSSPVTKTPKNNYEHLLETENLVEALTEHFSYLCDNNEFENVLKKIMQEAKEVRTIDKNLVIDFSNDEELVCSPPAKDIKKYKHYPESFLKLIKNHEYISFGEDQSGLHLGAIFYDHLDYIDDCELVDLVDEPEEILNPITDYSDWWLYHPEKINANGEPALIFFSHNEVFEDNPVGYNTGSLFLKLLAEKLKIDIEIPGANSKVIKKPEKTQSALKQHQEKRISKDPVNWYHELTPEWQNGLKEAMYKKTDDNVSKSDLKKSLKKIL